MIINFTSFDVSDPQHDKKYEDIPSTDIELVTDIASAEGEELCHESFKCKRNSVLIIVL